MNIRASITTGKLVHQAIDNLSDRLGNVRIERGEIEKDMLQSTE